MKTKSEEQGERRQTQTEKGRKATGGYQPQTEGPRERTVAIREIRISVEEQMAKVKEELEKRDYECTPMKYTKGGWRLNREMVGHVIDASSKEKRATVRGQFTTYGGTGPGDFFPVQFDVTTEDPVIMEVIEKVCGKKA